RPDRRRPRPGMEGTTHRGRGMRRHLALAGRQPPRLCRLNPPHTLPCPAERRRTREEQALAWRLTCLFGSRASRGARFVLLGHPLVLVGLLPAAAGVEAWVPARPRLRSARPLWTPPRGAALPHAGPARRPRGPCRGRLPRPARALAAGAPSLCGICLPLCRTS